MSEPEPFLILHKVRGEPAFDIATLIGLDGEGEELWIIPTSGHRAYPYWHESLANIDDTYELRLEFAGHINSFPNGMTYLPSMPSPWPDHYACNNPGAKPSPKGQNLLEALGLAQKIDRRF